MISIKSPCLDASTDPASVRVLRVLGIKPQKSGETDTFVYPNTQRKKHSAKSRSYIALFLPQKLKKKQKNVNNTLCLTPHTSRFT